MTRVLILPTQSQLQLSSHQSGRRHSGQVDAVFLPLPCVPPWSLPWLCEHPCHRQSTGYDQTKHLDRSVPPALARVCQDHSGPVQQRFARPPYSTDHRWSFSMVGPHARASLDNSVSSADQTQLCRLRWSVAVPAARRACGPYLELLRPGSAVGCFGTPQEGRDIISKEEFRVSCSSSYYQSVCQTRKAPLNVTKSFELTPSFDQLLGVISH